jgi:restriction system protein
MHPLVVALAVVAALLLPAAVWLTLRRQRPAGPAASFAGMRERDFELLVAAAFRAQGYEPIGVADGSPANVGQLVLRRERTTFLVECRHFRAAKVDVGAVHALQRAMAARGAGGGFVLSGGRFSREAIAFAGGCGVRLVDGPLLQGMLGRSVTR